LLDLQPLLSEKFLLLGQALFGSPSRKVASDECAKEAKAPTAAAGLGLRGSGSVAMSCVVDRRASRIRILCRRGDCPEHCRDNRYFPHGVAPTLSQPMARRAQSDTPFCQ